MTVVFDLGGVVVTWEPEKLIAAHFPEAPEADLVREGLFRHDDWVEMDRGTMEVPEAARRAAARTGLAADRIEAILYAIPPSLKPIRGTVALIEQLRKAGHTIVALSNMPFPSIDYLEQQEWFTALFDGSVISCRVNLVKPDAAIFGHLVSDNGLDPGQTIFFDDTPVNVEGARDAGLRAELFTTPESCRGVLEAAGYLDGAGHLDGAGDMVHDGDTVGT